MHLAVDTNGRGLFSPLEGALLVGQQLCLDAYWDRDQRLCNWMGRTPIEAINIDGPLIPTTSAIGPDLYGGSTGIALFLAHLFALTSDEIYRRTALGAIRRSLREITRTEAIGKWPILSVFSGCAGIAYAAARIAALTTQSDLYEQAATLLERVQNSINEPHLLDIIGGNAGAILAFLRLDEMTSGKNYRNVAIALGEELCQSAIRKDTIWTWDAEKVAGKGVGNVFLTGFAHGAAGIGLALLELYARTHRAEFLQGGRAAFAYEDACYSPEHRNWPDLRPFDSTIPRSARYNIAWCHGAAGIALARLCAVRLDPERAENHSAIADIAVTSTREAVEKSRQIARYDSTLCHGLGGLLEVLWTSAQLKGSREEQVYVMTVARELVENYARLGDWPSGLPSSGPNPSLMIGTAGVGYLLLRLYKPQAVPSILVLGPNTSGKNKDAIG
jgi:lantibiotic modifying enzyme